MIPRSTSHASNGDRIAPAAFWTNWILSACALCRSTTAPPTVSLCPFRNLVVEWMTASAPSESGCWRYGVAKVLSTTSIAPTACDASAALRMSTTLSIGFDGVSTQTMRTSSSRYETRLSSNSLAGTYVNR